MYLFCDGCGHRHKRTEMKFEGKSQICTTPCCSVPPGVSELVNAAGEAIVMELEAMKLWKPCALAM